MDDAKIFDKIIQDLFKSHEDEIKKEDKLEKARLKQESRFNPEVRKHKKKKLTSLPTLDDQYIKSCVRILGILAGNSCQESSHEELVNWSKYKHQFGVYDNIDRAMIHILYALEDFNGVHDAIERSRIPIDLEIEVEDLWHNASYKIDPNLNKRIRYSRRKNLPSIGVTISDLDTNGDPKNLTAVNRYRIRKRLPCPTTSRYEGGKKYKISQRASELMSLTFQKETKPSRSSKEDIAKQTGLKIETVSNWFKNRRQRAKARLSCLTTSSREPNQSPNLTESSQMTLTQTEVLSSQDINNLNEMVTTTTYHSQYSHYSGDTFSCSQGSYYPPSIVVQRSNSQDHQHHQVYEQSQTNQSPPDMDYEYNFQTQISPAPNYSAEHYAACDYVDQYLVNQTQQQEQNSYYHYQQDIQAGGEYL